MALLLSSALADGENKSESDSDSSYSNTDVSSTDVTGEYYSYTISYTRPCSDSMQKLCQVYLEQNLLT